MIRVRTCFAAEGLAVDRETNQVSAFGLVEHYRSASFPAAIPRLFFFCLWERDGGDAARWRAAFSAALNRRQLAQTAIDIDFEQVPRNRSIVRIDDLKLDEPGALLLELAIAGQAAAQWRIDVGEPKAGVGSGPATGGISYESAQITMSMGQVNIRRRPA